MRLYWIHAFFISLYPWDVIFISKLIPSEIKSPLTSLLSFLKKVKHTHFANGDLKLKCTATISTVYWKSNEESVQGSGFNAHTAPVSESRGRTSGENQLNICMYCYIWTYRLWSFKPGDSKLDRFLAIN